MAEIDLSGKTDQEIEQWVANYEKKGATNEPFFKKLLEERARRQSRGLNLETSLRHLIAAATDGRFTTYGNLAKASAVPWSVARHAMNGSNGHLERLLDICHARELPLLTALCVNQSGIDTGELGTDALRGFISGAQRLGYKVTDADAFLRDCQRKSFEWAKTESPNSN
jgi:hypothetical protein